MGGGRKGSSSSGGAGLPPVVSCYFCRQTRGAMKSTKDGRTWAHVQCVWYDPDGASQQQHSHGTSMPMYRE